MATPKQEITNSLPNPIFTNDIPASTVRSEIARAVFVQTPATSAAATAGRRLLLKVGK